MRTKDKSPDHPISPVTQAPGFHSVVSGSDHWDVPLPTSLQKCWPPMELTQHYLSICPLLLCFGTQLGPPLTLTSAVRLSVSDPALLFSIAFSILRNAKESVFLLQSYVEARTVCLVSASLVKSCSTEYMTNNSRQQAYARLVLSALCASDFLFNSHKSFNPLCMSWALLG